LAGAGQGTQLFPQLSGLALLAQLAPQAWKPAAQEKPHDPLLQVEAPLAGAGQGVHAPPQVLRSLLLTQLLPQRWKPGLQTMPHWPAEHVA
jgi:hypothetical protein